MVPWEPHGERIADKVRQTCQSLNVADNRVVSLVHDEASNMVAGRRKLEEEQGWASAVCAAHRLQTCIKHAIDQNRSMTKLLARGRKLVGHFRQSAQATEALAKKQDASPPLKVVQDCPTRWNSALHMLERLVKLEIPPRSVFKDNNVIKKDQSHLLLKDPEWRLAGELVDTLHHCEVATIALGGEQYCTMSMVAPVIHGLCAEVEDLASKSKRGSHIHEFQKCLLSELHGKFNLKKLTASSLPSLCAAVDPRFRDLSLLPVDVARATKENFLQAMFADECDKEDGPEEGRASKVTSGDEPPAKKQCTALGRLLKRNGPLEKKSLSARLETELTLYFTEDVEAEDVDR